MQMNNNVIIIGDSGDMKLPESHRKEYGRIRIVRLEDAQNDERYIGATPQRGVVFIKHPYMDCYVANNEDLDYNICSAMVGDLSIFAQELGARHIEFSITISSKKLFTNRTELKVTGGSNEGAASGKYKKELTAFAKLSEKRNFIREDDALSEEEYNKAKKHFDNSELFKHCDPSKTAKSLLMGRNPQAKTKSSDDKLIIDKTINLNDDLSIAISYKKASILKANSTYTQNRKFKKHIHIEMLVDFMLDSTVQP